MINTRPLSLPRKYVTYYDFLRPHQQSPKINDMNNSYLLQSPYLKLPKWFEQLRSVSRNVTLTACVHVNSEPRLSLAKSGD